MGLWLKLLKVIKRECTSRAPVSSETSGLTLWPWHWSLTYSWETLTLAAILMMVAARRASLSSDNSYYRLDGLIGGMLFLYARLQTGRIMVWWCPSGSPSVRLSVRPSGSPSIRPSARFPHFSPTYFDILSWNFAHDFVLMYYRSSSTVVTLRQFWRSYASLWT